MSMQSTLDKMYADMLKGFELVKEEFTKLHNEHQQLRADHQQLHNDHQQLRDDHGAILQKIVETTNSLSGEHDEIIKQIDALETKLFGNVPADPGPMTGVFSQMEHGMKLDLALPTFNPDTDDVADREMVTLIGGAEKKRENIGADPAMLTYTVFGLNQGDKVRCELRNVDDGSPPNKSINPSVFEGTANVSGAADTVAPGDPGAMSGVFSEETPGARSTSARKP